MDPPFNTGRAQARHTLTVAADADGDRDRVRRPAVPLEAAAARSSYDDEFADYLGFLEPRLRARPRAARAPRHAVLPHRLPRGPLLQAAARRDLRPRGVPQRADLGLRLRRQAAPPLARQARHDPRLRPRRPAPTTSTPTRSSASRTWRRGSSPRRRPRAASGPPTSGSTRSSRRTGREKTGYPTQKPEGVLRRIVAASSRPGGWCLDPFAGSGTLGAVCLELGRRFVLIDSEPGGDRDDRPAQPGPPMASARAAAHALRNAAAAGAVQDPVVAAQREGRVPAASAAACGGTTGMLAEASPSSAAFQTVKVAPEKAGAASVPAVGLVAQPRDLRLELVRRDCRSASNTVGIRYVSPVASTTPDVDPGVELEACRRGRRRWRAGARAAPARTPAASRAVLGAEPIAGSTLSSRSGPWPATRPPVGRRLARPRSAPRSSSRPGRPGGAH